MHYLIESTDIYEHRNTFSKARWDSIQLKYDNPHIFTSHFTYIAGTNDAGNATNVMVPYLAFDFDDATNLSRVQSTTINFIKYLEEIYEVNPDELGVYFSGYKGWHVIVPAGIICGNESFISTPEVLKRFALELTSGFNFVDQSIYHLRALLRQPDRVNMNTGFYKTRFTWQEIREFGLLDVQKASKQMYIRDIGAEANKSKLLYEKFLSCQENVTIESIRVREVKDNIDTIFRQAKLGERNVRASKIVGLLVRKIDDITIIQHILRLWNNNNSDPMPVKELQSLVSNIYRRYKHGKF
jgi:hypothetical protein